jgi:hypothetical protein
LGSPQGPEVEDDSLDLIVPQRALKGGHAALETRDVEGSTPVLDYTKKEAISVMPRMAGTVVRWRGVASVCPSHPPIRVALPSGTVTGRAVGPIKLSSPFRLLLIAYSASTAAHPHQHKGQQNKWGNPAMATCQAPEMADHLTLTALCLGAGTAH